VPEKHVWAERNKTKHIVLAVVESDTVQLIHLFFLLFIMWTSVDCKHRYATAEVETHRI